MSILTIFCLLFLSCSSESIQPQPDWVNRINQNDDYWYGVGISNKHSSTNSRDDARTKASVEISSQISVQLSSKFTNVKTEYNFDINEYTKSVVESRVENNLKNIEYINFYEDDEHYYVEARLSKELYYKTIELERDNAVQTVLKLINKVNNSFSGQSFQLLQDAFDEIYPYLDVPIYAEISGENVNLYSYLKLKFIQLSDRIKIMLPPKKLEFTYGIGKKQSTSITCIDNNSNQPIKGIKLKIQSMNESHSQQVMTNSDGIATFNIPNADSFKRIDNIIISPFFEELTIYSGNGKSTSLNIFYHPPIIQLQIDEYIFGNKQTSSIVEANIKSYFAEKLSANFSSSNPHVLIKGEVSTSKKSDNANEWGIYQTHSNITLWVSDVQTNSEIYSTSLTNIQGADFTSNENSAKHSLKNLSEKLETSELIEILSQLQQ
jgi:hypothetical protein